MIKSSQTVNCFLHLGQWADGGKANDIYLKPNQDYSIEIDYPLENSVQFTFNTGKNGLGFAGVVNRIVEFYKRIYRAPTKYGVYGHDFEDLSLGGFKIDHKKKLIRLYIGS